MRLALPLFLAVVLTVPLALHAVEEERTWTDEEGRKLRATLIVYSGRAAALKTARGNMVTLLVRKLSVDDQLYLKSRPELHKDAPLMRSPTALMTAKPLREIPSSATSSSSARKTPSKSSRSSVFHGPKSLRGARGLNGARGLGGASGL